MEAQTKKVAAAAECGSGRGASLSDTDSERWEDFFGSTTELAPSLLGIYDTLTSTFAKTEDAAAVEPKPLAGKVEASLEITSFTAAKHINLNNSNSSGSGGSIRSASSGSRESLVTTSASQSQSTLSLSAAGSSSSSRHRSNIRVLSANVQRMITHSDALHVDAVDIDAIQQQQQQQQQQSLNHSQFNGFTQQPRVSSKKPATSLPQSHKVKLSLIPLSKTTGKLTQSGTELVQTFDSSSSEYTAKSDLVDKTPTNNAQSYGFSDDSGCVDSTLQESPSEMESVVQQPPQASTPVAQQPRTVRPKEFITTEPLSPIEAGEIMDFELITQHIEQLTLQSELTHVVQAINKPLVTKSLVRSCSTACASTVAGSPLLTYARTKSLHAARANTIGGPMPIKLPTADELAELEEANRISAESLDRLSDIKSKFSPKESRRLMLPDIAKLKHRPLSSSSICSTSSSSSSGSDHLNGGKLVQTSYLASVESLAESENDIGDPHSGMTVFERACLEIVDSERNYVEDLGQVIRGYLHDWKERACLRVDELQTLFSNIEEIYEFNALLLKQLANSGTDPHKIAKCFIDLRERFDVYTIYCTSYPEAISLLTKLLQATHTNALLASTQKMLQHTLPLGSYLLKPVQRILKYHLLLDNLRKHCDVKEVLQAYELMRQVARNIDQVKRKLEQQSRVKELSGILDGWLGPELTVLGELRQEGLLVEHSKPRLVFLFATMLIITKQKEDGRLQFKSYIHQNNLMLSEHLPGEPTSFYVIPYDEPRHQIKLTAKNRDQKRLWAQHIKGVILEKFDNIPKRAKELVYQLGDEEDRTPDKNTWKWSLHSNSSTPVYLERRNQFRRSEMRNRSKFKRKTVSNSTSFDSFNEAVEEAAKNQEAPTPPPKPKPTVTRMASMDDNMLPALQKLAAVVRSRSTKRDSKQDEPAAASEESRGREPKRSPIFGHKPLKERSKSVPRIGSTSAAEELDGGNKTATIERKTSKAKALLDIRQYTHKAMPKRIATMKKQRQNKKETSTFYMALDEFESSTATVLKITESSEDLTEQKPATAVEQQTDAELAGDVVQQYYDEKSAKEQQEYESLSPGAKRRRDAEIILELLKDNKEFERICNKQAQKRKECSSNSPPQQPSTPESLPPRPPSCSPPPLDLDSEHEADKQQCKPKEKCDEEEEEHIYESLLRNYHIPYKFSPLPSRPKYSQPQPTQTPTPATKPVAFKPRERRSKPLAVTRPDSDYVTLIYSPEGVLQQVGEDAVKQELRRDSSDSTASASTSSSSGSTVKRDSQNTVVNLEFSANGSAASSPATTPTGNGHGNSSHEPLYARPIPKNLLKRLLSSSSGSGSSNGSSKCSLENVSTSESSLFPRSLGFARSSRPPERHVSDVSEMCRQSVLHRQGSEAVGERMAHVDYADPRTLFCVIANSEASLQRDSVFSLTSSNDSVCDAQKKLSSAALTSYDYEESVEECLENDFRDSAIYSDDNDKRYEFDAEPESRPKSPVPPPPPPRNRQPPQLALKPTVVPPPPSQSLPGLIVCPPHMNQTASRSWVLQQIENFNK